MRCTSCGAQVPDGSAVCPECGTNLGTEEAVDTASIELRDGSDTERFEEPRRRSSLRTSSAIKDVLASRGWVDSAAAAAMSWLALLCVAAVLLLAPKLQFPGFAKGVNPVDIFTGMVIVALGILRVPIHIGDLTIVALPLGALAAVALVVVWASRAALDSLPEASARPWHAATRIAAVFAVLGWLMALIFRFRGDEPVGADAFWALVLSFLWGFGFAGLGLSRKRDSWRVFARRVVIAARLRSQTLTDGLMGAGIMLGGAALLATAGLLLWIIATLARDAPYGGFGIGDAGAAVLYLAAFLPNVIVALIALSLGAPIYRGAQVGIGGRRIGELQELSLIDWPGGPPWYAFLLLAIPLVACLFGGYWIARRNAGEGLWRALVLAAAAFSLTLALAGWLGEARVGAGLVEQRGFARVAISPIQTFAWGMLWSAVCGWLGSELALRSPVGKET